ncbi:MAG TPA: hypothetical protein VFX16_30840 [Pseudonocardiaceae bacterium]|nr:hypothetical protein [Pseudonocardiaceae bacterium]
MKFRLDVLGRTAASGYRVRKLVVLALVAVTFRTTAVTAVWVGFTWSTGTRTTPPAPICAPLVRVSSRRCGCTVCRKWPLLTAGRSW